MPNIDFQVTTRLFTQKGHKKVARLMNRQMLVRVKLQYWPKHFAIVPETFPGAGGYRYSRRRAKYTAEKAAEYGHQKPNVMTGDLEDAILNGAAVVTATATKSTLRAKGPYDPKLGKRRPLTDERRRELQAISNREQKSSREFWKAGYISAARRREFKTFRRVKRKRG